MRINWNNVLTGGAFVAHVGLASLVVGAATVWAVVGLLGLPPPVAAVLYTAALAAALVATATFARIAHEAQPFFERIPEEPGRSSDPSNCDAGPL